MAYLSSYEAMNAQLLIENITIKESRPSYTQQYHRGYNINLSDGAINTLANNINRDRGKYNTDISRNSLRETPDIFTLNNANSGVVAIPNGWNVRRLKIILTVRVKLPNFGDTLYYINGYSEYYDSSLSGAIDENNTVFYINSITEVSETIDPITNLIHVAPRGSYNILRNFNDNRYSGHTYNSFMDIKASRPKDILESAYQVGNGGQNIVSANDLVSDRHNAISSDYAIKLINSITAGGALCTSNSHNMDVINNAKRTQHAAETTMSKIPFIVKLGMIRGNGIGMTTEFTLMDLERLCPGSLGNYIFEQYRPNVSSDMLYSDYTEDNGAPTVLNVKIQEMVQGLISLLSQNALAKVGLSANNLTNPPTVAVAYATSIIENISDQFLQGLINKFVVMFSELILPSFSKNNMITYELHIDAHLMSDTSVSVRYGSGAHIVTFRFPTFTDGLNSGVMTSSVEHQNLTADTIELVDYII